MRTAPAGEAPFKHLIYPIPEEAGLGTHLTLGVADDAKFGPDSQWIAWDPDEGPDYAVDPARCEKFYGGVRLHGSCCAELLRICLDSQFALRHAAMWPMLEGAQLCRRVWPHAASPPAQLHTQYCHFMAGMLVRNRT